MADYTSNTPLNFDDEVLYSSTPLSFSIDETDEGTDLADGDTYAKTFTGVLPSQISVGVFPGTSATMNVEFAVSSKYAANLIEWPSGAVTDDTVDIIVGRVYIIKISVTGGTGKFFIGS